MFALSQSRKGFTLVEVMVVVMIISMLLSVATPQFVRANLKAREARLKADLKAVRDAQEIAFNDIGLYPWPWQLDKAVLTDLTGFPGGLAQGQSWYSQTIDTGKWKGPYLKKYPSANPINGVAYSYDSNPTDVTDVFFAPVNATSTEGTNYRTW
jgi:prepilin-type N-terminal cleavage/methylation domain-containing protein